MDHKQTQEPRESEVGQRAAAPSQSRMKMRLGGESSWGTRKVCELGQGVCYVLGYLEGLTKATVVIVFAYDTATLIFFQRQVTETGLDIKNKVILSILSLPMITLYFIFFFVYF